jgi:nucleotide-binding universal stress UspA family protein
MKNVMLLVHDDAGQEARFQAALDLTRALEGHLTCVDVAVFPQIIGDIYAVSVEAALFADEQMREKANRKTLEARLAKEGVSWSWVDATGAVGVVLKERAQLADIIVVSRRLSEPLPDMRAIASEVVIGSGCTVLAVPDDARGFDAAGHAMVAWDGSSEAIDALQSAVPLLSLAKTVTIVEVKDGTVELPAEDAASYLSRHGIKPVVVRRRARGEPTGDVLLAEAQSERADYMVMGGFGRSRIAEAVFGGVSREMLTDSPIPVVMTH